MNCQAIICNELTESGSLFCGYHRESGESLYCPEDMEKRFFEWLNNMPEGEVRNVMMLRFIPYWRNDRIILRGNCSV